jgi:hypothetical protein
MEKYESETPCYTGGSSANFAEQTRNVFGDKNNYEMKNNFDLTRLLTSLFIFENETELRA